MKTLLLSLFLFLQYAHASGKPELVVVATDNGGYPAKALCYFSNNYMVPHPKGLLVLYTCFGGPDINSEIWLVNEKPVQIGVSTMGNLFTEVFVRGEDMYFFEFSEFETVALWKYHDGVLTSQKLPANLKDSHVHELTVLGDKFYFTYTNHESMTYGEGIYDGTNFTLLPNRGQSFLWKGVSNSELMLQKAKYETGEVIELRTRDNTSPVVVLSNTDYPVLRNQFALRGDHWATFAKNAKGLVLIRGVGTKTTSEDISGVFKDIQYWAPALASDGEVIFRGTDINNEFALWGYKDGVKRKIVGANQEITVETETVITSSTSLLYNSPAIDEKGNLFIGVGLRSPGAESDFGQGILKL
jgi:hypothetical protein